MPDSTDLQALYAIQLQAVPTVKTAIDDAAARKDRQISFSMRFFKDYPMRLYAAVGYAQNFGISVLLIAPKKRTSSLKAQAEDDRR